ncbi:MAG: class E sortase [Actinomycetota bacterium]|nr:class E sortase [Actinomycetota bacterium]
MTREKIRGAVAVVAVVIIGVLIWSSWATRELEEPKVTRLLNNLKDEDGRDEASNRSKANNMDRAAGDSPIAGSKKTKRIRFVIPKERYLPIGRLRIPDMNLDVAFRDGVHDDILTEGPGHWPGTPLPGEAGNAVLSGHRTTYTHPFGGLDLLEPGDTVKTKLKGERMVRFEVTRNTVVPEAGYADFVLKQPKKPKVRSITMFACHPKGYRTHRIVVQAKAVSLQPAK